MKNGVLKFIRLKTEVIRRAKKQSVCSEGYAHLRRCYSFAGLMTVAKENFLWCCEKNIIDAGLIERYKLWFNDNGIYCNKCVLNGYILCTSYIESISRATECCYMAGGTVGTVCSMGRINDLFGSGVVENVYGVVDRVHGGVVVENVYGVVDRVRGGSVVKNVCDNGIVKNVLNNGIVKNVFNNGIVKNVFNNGVVENVCDNGVVKTVRSGGDVITVCDNGIIERVIMSDGKIYNYET